MVHRHTSATILCTCSVVYGMILLSIFPGTEAYTTGFNRAYIDFASLCERMGERGTIVFAKTRLCCTDRSPAEHRGRAWR
jgi:hypothetical protein